MVVVANVDEQGDRVNDATRRKFLTMAGAGTAAGVAAVALPGTAAAATEDARLPADADGAMVAYIHDVKRGEVSLMVEGREVIVTDKPLVARLARAFARA